MASSIADAFRAAFEIKAEKRNEGETKKIVPKLKPDIEFAAPKNEAAHSNLKPLDREKKEIPISYGKSHPKQNKKTINAKLVKPLGQVSKSDDFKKGGRRASKQEYQALLEPRKTLNPRISVYSNSSTKTPESKTALVDEISPYTLDFPQDTKFTFDVNSDVESTQLTISNPKLIEHSPSSNNGGDRDLTIGLDFGTSCVKCVIGDRTIKQAYAIPFIVGYGIDIYLLPSVLYQHNEEYSLIKSNKSYNNLKLGFIETPNNEASRAKMAAFIALVLRQAITWFFKEHNYINNKINWALSIGVPAPQGSANLLTERYKEIARAAWYQAWNSEVVSNDSILIALRRASLYDEKVGPASTLEDVEIYAIPEIAAQIHGFLEAESFDKKGRNIYLLVDVGAGTVDSSLFHVEKVTGKSKFSFFESKVENLGVMNLHRKRLDWWKKALSNIGNSAKTFVDQIDSVELLTESKIIPPNHLEDYFDKSKISFNSHAANPDIDFRNKLNAQVISTYRGSFRNASPQTRHNNLYGISAFLCGGGFKMPFYHSIKSAIHAVQGHSYLHATPIHLQKPSNLESPGVGATDYSRLSVAYGLSFIRAEVEKALPFEKETELPDADINSSFVGKDDI